MTITAMTMNSRVLSTVLGLTALYSVSTAQTGTKSTTPVATVGSERILLSDVERAYQKNLTRRDQRFVSIPRDSAMEFLRLYTNYRLKVLDAKDRGIDKDSAVKVDLANNRRLLSEMFFYDKAIADRRVEELSRRRMKEMKIGIILCAVQNPVTRQWDTVASKAKAERFIAALKAGADFEKLARDSSDDKETASGGGLLPWSSGGSILKAVAD